MASLDEILKKTKAKTEKLKLVGNIKPPSAIYISDGDRPYTQDVSEIVSSEDSKKVNTNQTQTKHKLDTNLTQEPDTNSTQTEHNVIAALPNLTQTTHKLNTQPNTTKTQTTHKPNTNLTQTANITALVGLQKRLLIFMFNECKKVCSRHTPPLTISYMGEHLNIAVGSIKTSVARLCDKAFITIESYKNGRGGWSVYEIPDDIYKELLHMETQHKLDTNLTQTTYKLDTQPNTQPNTSVSSSSSNILITTTTNNDSEWSFDISPFRGFGFTHTHLLQLEKACIDPNLVEQSLYEFKFDFENNSLPPIKTGNINFLMGLFRKGVAYTSDGYRNEEEALIVEMANKAKEKRKKLIESKFLLWENSLTQEMRKKLMDQVPIHLRVIFDTAGINDPTIKSWLMDYFLKKVNEGIDQSGL